MCGIAGVLSVERPVTADMVAAVLRMLDTQVHRGPNDWGILIPEEARNDLAIRALLEPRGWEHVRLYPGPSAAPAAVLGSRRLSILDLSAAGRMPMMSHDGRVSVTYNGEIYNFKELRDDLLRLGHTFHSNSDTEVLLHGYQQWGEGLPTHLRGMFAFAVLDARRDHDPKLFLAKDRFGIKPLYWARHDCTFQFASEVRALIAGRLIPNEPEPRGLHGFLMSGSVPTPWTTVRGVLSLSAAEFLNVDQRSYSFPKPSRYWAPPPVESVREVADAPERTRQLLASAVKEQLVSDVPIGVFLSGGMDSSAIVALAAQELDRPLTTLCVTFDETEFSERAYAKIVADRFRTNHVEVRVRRQDFIEELPRFFDSLDQPTADGVNSYFVAKAARAAGLTVVLSGLGGDELFWGYPGFRSYGRLRSAARMPLVRPAIGFVGAVLQNFGLKRLEKLEFLAEHPLLGPYLTIRGFFPPRRAASLLDSGQLPIWQPDLLPGGSDGMQYGRLELDCYMQNQLLRDTDVFAMRHSVEVRVPFLDHRLAEFLLRLPASTLRDGTGTKPLLAKALRSDYPTEILNRQKMGFTFPFGKWIRDAWSEIYPDGYPAASVVSNAAFDQVTSDYRRERLHWSRAWALLVLRAAESRGLVPVLPNVPALRRILFVLPQVYGSIGGIPAYNQGLLRAVSEALPRTELHVVSLNDGQIEASAALRGRVHFTGVGPRSKRVYRPRMLVSALRAGLRARPDLIVTGHINIVPFTELLAVITGTPNMMVAHGIEAWAPPRRLQRVAQGVTKVLAVSRYTADRLKAWGIADDRITVLPNMVDGEVFRPIRHDRASSDVTVLTVARLDATERYKGVEQVMNAIRNAAPEKSIRYVVAGTGDDLPRLREVAMTSGLGDRVEFRGFVPAIDLPSLYSGADVFVMPSKKEGFGIVFLEALACGTPVVGGDQDGSIDALMNGKWGHLVDPDSTDDILAAILDNALPRPDRKALLDAYGPQRFRSKVHEVLTSAI